jgi:UDP-2,3-diacylglucosamine pyrophosphatase LpxH
MYSAANYDDLLNIHEANGTTDVLDDGASVAASLLDVPYVETMIVSDIHLGSDVSRSAELLSVLKSYAFSRLILNGDVFDDLNFKRLRKEDWKFLSYIRKLSNPKRACEVIWVAGNHDGLAEPLSHLLGVKVYDEYIWESAGNRLMATHGHQFDTFLRQRVVISSIASWIYLWLQRADRESQRVSRWVKRTSKAWLRVSDKIARDAIEYAACRNVDVVFCGHTHHPLEMQAEGIRYFNSGCWTDRPSQYITIDHTNRVTLHELP